MNIFRSFFISLLTLSATSLSAQAALPDRAQATPFVPKRIVQYSAPTSGNSQTPPQILAGHLHQSVASRADAWYWGTVEVFHGQFIVYGGYDHGVLVNRLEFLAANPQTFSKQYVIHYDTLASGFQRTTVETYGQDDSYQGKTEYLASVVNNKLYLAQINNYSRYNYKESTMDVHWSSDGVTATIGRETINLSACQHDWLPKHFALYQHFGLKV